MDLDLEMESDESHRAWREKFNLDDFDKKVTIGAGSFGQVILVQHKPSGQLYALKVLPVAHVIHMKQVDHVWSEKEILKQLSHPFIVNLVWSYHDLRLLYMLFEYVGGGELFGYLSVHERFSNDACRFYASELTLAIEYIHSQQVAYRDLKPENLLLDRTGHIKIADFGFAKKIDDRTYTLCGTPDYLAPEIIQNKGHSMAVDWWALGVLIYEMLSGSSPFASKSQEETFEKILAGKIVWPQTVNKDAKDLISKFLQTNPTNRLGNMKRLAQEVKDHPWFRGVRWDDVYAKQLKPPFIPEMSSDDDTRNFATYNDSDWLENQKRVMNAMLLFYNF